MSSLNSIEKFPPIFVIESAGKALITVSVKPNYKRTMKERLFTKSAFKVALTCPTQLFCRYVAVDGLPAAVNRFLETNHMGQVAEVYES